MRNAYTSLDSNLTERKHDNDDDAPRRKYKNHKINKIKG